MSAFDIVKIARKTSRPSALEYIDFIFDRSEERRVGKECL